MKGSSPKSGGMITPHRSYLLIKSIKTMEIMDLIISWLVSYGGELTIGEPVCAFMWIPMAISAAASLGSALASSNANRKNEKKLKAMADENQQDYLRDYYRGALDNEGSKAYLKRLDERLKRNDAATENALVAQGATHENALAAKQRSNEVYSDAVANLVESEESRKDAAKAQYKEGKKAIAQGEMQQNANEAATWSQVGQGITSAANAVTEAGGWEDLFKKKAVGTGNTNSTT